MPSNAAYYFKQCASCPEQVCHERPTNVYVLITAELGRQALICAGAFYALRNLPKSESDNVALADLKLVRDIFDEVYEGHLPEKLHYKEVQPLLLHALSGDGSDQSFKDAHKFLSDYTNLTPCKLSYLNTPDTC